MKRLLRTIPFIIAFLLTVSALIAGPGMQLGRVSLGHAPAPVLAIAGPINMYSAGFVAAVGGVAFSNEARPAASLTVSTLRLKYDAAAADGDRAVVELNGDSFSLPLYDWQLVPIARYANGTQAAVVTAFGSLHSAQVQAQAQAQGDHVINYHTAFNNTLLGLRLMQADIALFVPDAVDLPKDDGHYLLGAGERTPNLVKNAAGWTSWHSEETAATQALGQYRSYVLSDEGVPITFDTSAGNLEIMGEPRYHFWRFHYEKPDYDAKAELAQARIDVASRLAAAQGSPGFSEKAWLLAQVKSGIDDIIKLETTLGAIPPAERAKMAVERQRISTALAAASRDELRRLLGLLIVKKASHEVDVMTSYTDRIEKAGVVRAINPTVYDAARATMRHAAFFRYVRSHYPVTWRQFLGSVRWRAVSPAVKTPTTLSP